MKMLNYILVVFAILLSQNAHAEMSILPGIGLYSQNFFGEVTKSADGKTAMSGTTSIPLIARLEMILTDSLFFAPNIAYTPIARKAAGGSSEIGLLHLGLPAGGLIFESAETWMDWSAGPGFTEYQIKGKGGIKTLSNGTGTSSFAAPGRTVKSRVATLDLGTSFNYNSSRFGLDLIFEGFLSKKRTQSFMLSYSYRFGGRI